MLFRLVRPMQRKGTLNRQFVQRIPADIRDRAVGMKLAIPMGPEVVAVRVTDRMEAIRVSLRTVEPSEVKKRQAQIAAYLETVWQALRNDGPIPLTHKQAVALSRDLYAAWADERDTMQTTTVTLDTATGERISDDEGFNPDEWSEVFASVDIADDDLERALGPVADRLLLRRGIAKLAPESRPLVLHELRRAFRDGMAVKARHMAGDYSPDPKSERFPAWQHSAKAASGAVSGISLMGLVEAWWQEAKAAGRTLSTYESYRNTFKRLAALLEHDNAEAVTKADIVRFKDHRLAQGLSPKTVGDSDIAGLRVVFGWAADNDHLAANPATSVKVTRIKQAQGRSRSFSEEEAKAILVQSLHHKQGRESAKLAAAKRWVPWLCAYTGARVGEMVQLRKQDVRWQGDFAVITITPDAGTVKDKEVREVVIHEHLVEQGFMEFVEAAQDGYLFLTPKDGEVRGVWRGVKNRLSVFARQAVKDEGVPPNHGWRHTFKTIGREAGIADSILDAICGHAAKTVGGSYGSVTLKAQRDALANFPRFETK